MRRVYKTRRFKKWAQKNALEDAVLLIAVEEMERGLIDADLGGGLFKKRIKLPGRGKRSGTRTLVASNKDGRWFFIGGYLKSEKENISVIELLVFRGLAAELLSSSEKTLYEMIVDEAIEEIFQ